MQTHLLAISLEESLIICLVLRNYQTQQEHYYGTMWICKLSAFGTRKGRMNVALLFHQS